MTLTDLKKIAKEKSVEFVDLKFCDLLGAWHHITIPISSLTATLFKNGVGVDGSSLPGFSSIERGDMILLPDPATAIIDPFFERPTLSMIGDIMEVAEDVTPYSRNPRRVTRDAAAYLAPLLLLVHAGGETRRTHATNTCRSRNRSRSARQGPLRLLAGPGGRSREPRCRARPL